MSMNNIALLTLPVVAAAALTAHRFVTPAGAQTAADGVSMGVANAAAAIGERCPVIVKGTAVVEAGAAIALGATVKSDASGRAITWASAGAKAAFALEAASAAGDFIEVLLIDNA